MNSNIKIFLLCPVPDDQKPINEYINLKQNDFFNWIAFSERKYNQKLFAFFINGFLILLPFDYLIFNPKIQFFSFFFCHLLITFFSFIFFLASIRQRWIEMNIRFLESRLFYEEGSWYDGQIWEKPLELIKNDKLLSIQKIEPLINRITKTIFLIFSFTIFIISLSRIFF
jgi:hypothetical protein